MKKFALCLSLLSLSTALGGDEKTSPKAQDSKTEVVVVGKPSRFRIVSQPVQVLKTETVTKTSSSPATLVVEEKKGLLGKWRTKNSTIVIKEEKK
jgi:hypothetical protein